MVRRVLLFNQVLNINILSFTVCLASPIQDHRWSLIPDQEGRMHLIDLNPMEVEVEPFFNPDTETRFLLFTRSNPTASQVLTFNAAQIRQTNFNQNDGVRFLIHGFNSGPGGSINTAPTAAYLQRGAFNVIVVDWSVGANTLNYITARNRVPLVATVVARFIDFLVSNGLTAMSRVTIAGVID